MSTNNTFLLVLLDLEKDMHKLSWKAKIQCFVYIMIWGYEEQDIFKPMIEIAVVLT